MIISVIYVYHNFNFLDAFLWIILDNTPKIAHLEGMYDELLTFVW